MPKLIQDIAQFLPFQLLIYFPIQLILGGLSQTQVLQGYVSGLIWLVVVVVLFNTIWRNGVKRFSAVGA
jgi:ABC-2 type transport system permease protein